MAVSTADHLRDASPWRAEPNPETLAVLGKMAEELGELQAAVARCIIQGLDGHHPVTGKPNAEWLLEEMADVRNMLSFIMLKVDPTVAQLDAHNARIKRKSEHIIQWLNHLKPFNP